MEVQRMLKQKKNPPPRGEEKIVAGSNSENVANNGDTKNVKRKLKQKKRCG
jgi:hypothetical protein